MAGKGNVWWKSGRCYSVGLGGRGHHQHIINTKKKWWRGDLPHISLVSERGGGTCTWVFIWIPTILLFDQIVRSTFANINGTSESRYYFCPFHRLRSIVIFPIVCFQISQSLPRFNCCFLHQHHIPGTCLRETGRRERRDDQSPIISNE